MFTNASGNGQLIAAVVILVDAVFGVLTVIGVVHTQPSESVVVIAVGAAFNVGGYIWAFIQHQQHVIKLQIAGAQAAAAIHAGRPVGAPVGRR